MKNSQFIKNAAVISLGGFISKAIGALYKIPLLRLIGSDGVGLYQLVYPFYCLLLTVSSSGVPSAIARAVADKDYLGGGGVIKRALPFFGALGFLGSIVLILLSSKLAALQGDLSLKNGYICIAPSVLFVSLISVLRGYFQGKNNMKPTAISEISEQVIKVSLSLILAYIYRENVYRAVSAVLFSVSVSEGLTLCYIYLTYKRKKYPLPLYTKGVGVREIVKISLPVAVSSAVLPFSQMIDSVIIVRLLKKYFSNAISLYGIFSGGALTLINLPVSLCYGLAVAAIPKISAALNDGDKRKGVVASLAFTLALSVPCALFLYLFSPFCVKILFSGFTFQEKELLIQLIRLLSVSAVTLSLTQTLSACLTAKKLAWRASFSVFVACALKTVLFFPLISEKTGVYGAAHAVNICYFCAFVINFISTLIYGERKDDHGCKPRRKRGRRNEKRREGDFIGRKSNFKDCARKIFFERNKQRGGLYHARLFVRKQQKF